MSTAPSRSFQVSTRATIKKVFYDYRPTKLFDRSNDIPLIIIKDYIRSMQYICYEKRVLPVFRKFNLKSKREDIKFSNPANGLG